MPNAPSRPAAAPPLAGSDSPGPCPRRWLMLPVVLMAMFMAGFDIWAVNVAAPSLQRDLHVSDAALQLIVGGYAFMYASGMVTGGRLGDLFGYRRMFMIGVISFAAASLLCGLAQTSEQLVAARLVQGLTGAAMVPQVLALITATFPAAERAAGAGLVRRDHGRRLRVRADPRRRADRSEHLRSRLAGDLPGERAGRHPGPDRRRRGGAAREGTAPAPARPPRSRGRLGQHRAGARAADAGPGPGLAAVDVDQPGGVRAAASFLPCCGSGGSRDVAASHCWTCRCFATARSRPAWW